MARLMLNLLQDRAMRVIPAVRRDLSSFVDEGMVQGNGAAIWQVGGKIN